MSNSMSESGNYPVEYYIQGDDMPFKISDPGVLGVPLSIIDGGNMAMDSALTHYDRVEGFSSDDYRTILMGWGDHAVVLPSLPQTTTIPLFWLNAEPIQGSDKKHFRVTPLTR